MLLLYIISISIINNTKVIILICNV